MKSGAKTMVRGISLAVLWFGANLAFVSEAESKTVVEMQEMDFSFEDEPSPIFDICDFPIFVTSQGHLKLTFVTDISDPNNLISKIITAKHSQWSNRYEANGKTLESRKVSYMIQAFFEAGVFKDFHTVGTFEKIPLPDGTTFMSAGHVSLNFQPEEGVGCFVPDSPCPEGLSYYVTVGAGKSGDVAAFCDALSE
jgi:hypothetical protein